MQLFVPKTRSIFDSDCQVLVCPTNIMGVMGNGLARAFRDRFEGLYEVFQRRCRAGYISNDGLNISNYVSVGKQYVLMFPTKKHFLDDSHPDYIRNAMLTLAPTMKELGVATIAFPKVGCGKGKLDWDCDVRPILIEHLSQTTFGVELYE